MLQKKTTLCVNNFLFGTNYYILAPTVYNTAMDNKRVLKLFCKIASQFNNVNSKFLLL